MVTITAPACLNHEHDCAAFDCGEDTLNDWLKHRALKNQDNGASRTFVICHQSTVIGYYALATGSVERTLTPGAIARNMPNPIPVIILARLAVDKSFQSQRLGAALLKDAILRTLNIASNVGVRALLVHALSDAAKHFYLSHGFQPSMLDDMTLFLPLSNRASF